jgi:uncharacterized LabA/DUF88 family protein
MMRRSNEKGINMNNGIGKAIVFLDGSNMFWASKEVKASKQLADYRIDYNKLIQKLREACSPNIVRTYYYGSIPPQAPPKQESYYSKLQILGIKVRLRKLQHQGDTYTEKGVDMLLAMDMLSLAYNNAFDTAILVSHDQDFVELVERVQALGKIVKVVGFKDMVSHELRKSCDDFVDLWDSWERIQFDKQKDNSIPLADIEPPKEITNG